jgi:hypothetical protein
MGSFKISNLIKSSRAEMSLEDPLGERGVMPVSRTVLSSVEPMDPRILDRFGHLLAFRTTVIITIHVLSAVVTLVGNLWDAEDGLGAMLKIGNLNDELPFHPQDPPTLAQDLPGQAIGKVLEEI